MDNCIGTRKKTDSGSTFLNNFMILPGSQIENLTCARLASSTTLYMRNVAGKMYIKKNVDMVRRTYATLTVDDEEDETLVFTGLRLAQTVLYLEAYPGHAVPRS